MQQLQQLEQLVGKDDLGSHSDLSDELNSSQAAGDNNMDMSDMEDDMSTDEFDMLADQPGLTEQQEAERHAQNAAKLYQQMYGHKSLEKPQATSQDEHDIKDEEVDKYLDDEMGGFKRARGSKENPL